MALHENHPPAPWVERSKNWILKFVRKEEVALPPAPVPLVVEPLVETPAAENTKEKSDDYPYIPDYKIKGLLGEGGMGIVYLAECTRPNDRTVVAVKLIRPELMRVIKPDEEKRAAEAEMRFAREIQALQLLQHPNIVQLRSAGRYDGRQYFVMDYVCNESGKSRTLEDLIREEATRSESRTRAPRWICWTVEKIAHAVQAAHDVKVIHRDLKPANILLGERDRPKVSDFGAAKAPLSDENGKTATGESLGTPGYMAPEQLRGDKLKDEFAKKVDIYALGCILYSLLTGGPPYGNNAQTTGLVLDAKKPPSPLGRMKAIAAERGVSLEKVINRGTLMSGYLALDEVCRKCLEPDSAKRYQTAGEVAEALGQIYYTNREFDRLMDRLKHVGQWLLGWRKIAAVALCISAIVAVGIRLWTNLDKEIKKSEASGTLHREIQTDLRDQLRTVKEVVPKLEQDLTTAKRREEEVAALFKADLGGLRGQVTTLEKQLADEKSTAETLGEQLTAAKKDAGILPGLRAQNEELAVKLKKAEAVIARGGMPRGELEFRLSWNNRNDLDLHCVTPPNGVDPNGEHIFYGNMKAGQGSGGSLDTDQNVRGENVAPAETIHFPADAPPGRYKVSVHYYSKKDDQDPTEYTLTIRIGDQKFTIVSTISNKSADHLYEFDLK